MTSTVEVVGSGDDALALRTWPAPTHLRGSMLIVHGLGEHSGRYEHVGGFFRDAGYQVTSFDLPGFGRSGGRRAHATSYDTFLDRVEERLGVLDPAFPKVLYGHSFGGQICLTYVRSGRPLPDRLVLSAPGVDAFYPQWQRSAGRALAKVLPRVAIPNQISGSQLSRDPAVGEAYDADPLNLHRSTLEFGALGFAAIDALQQDPKAPPVPTYVLHGGADTIVSPRFTAPLGAWPNVTRRLWPALRHETHNEPEWQTVLGEVAAWLDT